MSWNGAWFGDWFGQWYGTQDAGDGSINGWSLRTLAGVEAVSAGALLVSGTSSATLEVAGTASGNGPAAAIAGTSAAEAGATYGDASGALAIAGTSASQLGDAVAGVPEQQPLPAAGGGILRPRRIKPSRLPLPLPAIVGHSAGVLDDVVGEASATATNVVTLRQRQGRRDDRDWLMVSGWR